MGVYRKDYIMLAIDIINLEDDFEKIEKMCNENELDYIRDNMSGEYCFIGKIIRECDEEDGIPMTKLDNLECQLHELKIKLQSLGYDKCPQLYVFSHYR